MVNDNDDTRYAETTQQAGLVGGGSLTKGIGASSGLCFTPFWAQPLGLFGERAALTSR